MASIFKILSFLLFLGLLFEVDGRSCSLRDVSIEQHETPFWAHGMPQVNVTIANNCDCPQAQLKLNCSGIQTYFAVDPSKLSISGDECLVNNGKPITQAEPVQFTYAWKPQFPFHPISSQIECHS